MQTDYTVYIVDDDDGIRHGLQLYLESGGFHCEIFSSAIQFLAAYDPAMSGCLVLDVRMPEMSGLELQEKLIARQSTLPIIFLSGHGDIPLAVQAMRRGAIDFIRKPFREADLEDRIREAFSGVDRKHNRGHEREAALAKLANLSKRERQVFDCVADGQMNKVVASELGISERTVEVHRAQVMKKLEIRSLAQLVRIQIAADTEAS